MDQVQQIREKIDLVSFISEFIPLKKTGNNFKANCPFHGEKTPSFVVSPQRQIWHCFGCLRGGSVYDFLMEYEHLEFGEALRILAKRTGVQLEESRYQSGLSAKKDKLYTINHQSSEFYHYILTKHNAGKKARLYLQERGINDRVLETFKIGYAPKKGNVLSEYLMRKKNYKKEDLFEAGISSQAGTITVDFFKDRIIFPLFDHRDNVIGFSGRILQTDARIKSKYINTKDTIVYHKGESFFGIQVAKDSVKKEKQAILVEGEFDVLSCFQAGITNTLAVKGTALTEAQVNLLSRFTSKITMCLDADLAGQEAIKRSLPILEKKNITTTIIVVPNGKDPDEAIKNDEFVFKNAVKHDKNVYDFLLESTLSSHNLKAIEGKKKITEELLPVFAKIENEIVKEHYLKRLSFELDTSYESIEKEIEKKTGRQTQTVTSFLPKERRTREELLEEYIVALILQSDDPKRTFERAIELLKGSISQERAYQKILDHMLTYFETTKTFDAGQFSGILPQELLPVFNICFLLPIPKLAEGDSYIKEIDKAAFELRELYIKGKIKSLGEKIKEKEKQGDSAHAQALQEQLSSLVSQLQTK